MERRMAGERKKIMDIEGAIFDIDGTVLNSMPVWHNAGARFLKSIGVVPEPELGDILFAKTSVSGAEYLIQHYHLDLTREQVSAGLNHEMEKYYHNEADFKGRAKELLQRMKKRGIPLTAATSTDRELMEVALKNLGVWKDFKEVLCCTDYQTTKAEPKLFMIAAEIMGSRPEKTWVFEDGLYAIRTAKAAGFRIAGIYDEVSLADQSEIKALSDQYLMEIGDFQL